MYFINYSKCSICQQKKSVVTEKHKISKVCRDCNPEAYNRISSKQKENWIIKDNNNKTSERCNN